VGREIEARFATGAADGGEVFAAVDVLLDRWGIRRVQDVYHRIPQNQYWIGRSVFGSWQHLHFCFISFRVGDLAQAKTQGLRYGEIMYINIFYNFIPQQSADTAMVKIFTRHLVIGNVVECNKHEQW
jgi:hypothetical protein